MSYAVSTLSRHLARPNTKVIKEAERVVRARAGTRDLSIRWTSDTEHVTEDMRNVMWGAVDASYAACSRTRRWHGGWLVYLNGGAISWKSGLQPMMTPSSCEAEFVALCWVILEVRCWRMLLNSEKESTLVWQDKQGCHRAGAESSSAGRAKHIDVRLKEVVENVRDGTVRVRYAPTHGNYADIMTKALSETKLNKVRKMRVSPRNEKGTMLRLIDEMAMLVSD